MKLIHLILVIFFSWPAVAQKNSLKLKLLLHGKEGELRKTSTSEVLALKPTMKFKAGSPFVLRGYIMGLTPDRDGLVKYTVYMQGNSRNFKIERRIGTGSHSNREEDLHYDEPAYEEVNHEIFWHKDVGTWDFHITVTDKVTGEVTTKMLNGVEVVP